MSLSAGVLGQRAAVAADPRTGSAIDEQRAGTVHGTRDEDISTRAAGGRPILRARFLMRWVYTANLPEESRSRRGQRDADSDPEHLHHRLRSSTSPNKRGPA